jgi:hypothetical protein
MDMEELCESLGGTKIYYRGASCYIGQHYQSLLYVVLQTTSKLLFSPYEVIIPGLSKFALNFLFWIYFLG